jgi:hypothetical protein
MVAIGEDDATGDFGCSTHRPRDQRGPVLGVPTKEVVEFRLTDHRAEESFDLAREPDKRVEVAR